ncbi:MAG: hypothetical protein JW837_01165 [Sedimentisphaerales bacterium]|nr:hypothetical protein [Sedimentisphaerales bacterium]
MELRRGIIIILIMATIAFVPCYSGEKKTDKDIWIEDEPKGPGPGGGPGGIPGHGEPGRGGKGRGRFELTEEEISRIIKSLQENNPQKARELKELRQKDPNQFNIELRRHGREEFGRIFRERFDKWMKERQNEFLQWLEKAVPKESRNLTKIKETNPNLYPDKYELIWKKYERIYEERRRNPELAEVLLEDLKLKETRNELVMKIRTSKDERQKQLWTAQLEQVVARRFDLIIRRKQIEYERLLQWLEELQDRITQSKEEIDKGLDKEYKDQNVKKRIQDLLKEAPGFIWD